MDPHTRTAIIRGKTAAWTSAEAVAVYERAMDDTSGSILLKNAIEPLLIGHHVRGRQILDVGIGTGRASLPLAARGLEVTGVDSSQGMLDATRRRAGDHPITLLPGDVTALPFADASFDSVVSLNVTTHFPHWNDILREWARVVRPGGRMVFDMLSADHVDSVARTAGAAFAALPPDPGGAYQLQVRASELIPEFDRIGLRVVGIFPYGIVSRTIASTSWLRGTLVEGMHWERILSWVAVDPVLFDMLVYIEEALAGSLSTDATGRFMVVVEKTRNVDSNARWLARNVDLARSLASGFSRASIEPFVGEANWVQWTARLREYVMHPPCEIALFRLYDMALAWHFPVDLDDLLGSGAQYIQNLAMRRRAESAVWQFVERLSSHPEIGPLLRVRPDIDPSLEWDLLPGLNERILGRWK